jgi:hypothetical protein
LVLGRFDDMPRFDAAGANNPSFGTSPLKGPHGLEVGVKTTLVDIMRMADMVADHWFFAADFTFLSHFVPLYFS